MNILHLNKTPIDLESYKLRSALESDFGTLITENTLLYDNDKLMIVYLKLDIESTEIVDALQRIKYSKQARSSGMVSTSKVFGFNPRVVARRDFCTVAALAHEQPEYHKVVCDYATRVSELYKQYNPNLFDKHTETAEQKVLKDYRLPGSPFTSGIINKNNPLRYHFDSGNFRDVWSVMLGFKHDVEGGHLACPEYGVGFEIAHNSVLMFDGQGILHGVTPIRRLSTSAFRYTIVYYSMREMWNCLPIDDELLRVRKIRTEREQKRFLKREKQDFKK